MKRCFVNLPLRYIANNRMYIDYFIRKRINPELGIDAYAIDVLDEDWHKNLADRLKKENMECSIHLPFLDLQPGSMDDLILEATRNRLKRAMEIAKIYCPRFLVAHANFIPFYSEFFSKWLNRSIETWKQVLEVWPEHPPLYLENVREFDPRPLVDLLSELSSLNNVKFCFDIGHWASYGGGSRYKNLAYWIQNLSQHLAHLHLHDNDGITDQHLGLGLGCIPWEELFSSLELSNLSPTFTLEPHTKEDMDHCWWFIKKHFQWFSKLGIRRQDIPS